MKPKRRKSKKQRAKSISLSKCYWLRNSKDIQEHREKLLKLQGGECAISNLPLEVGTLDHKHSDGGVRKVLHTEINLLEGIFLKKFNRLKLNERFGLTFADTLINMGTYLKQPYTSDKLHYMYMSDCRKKIQKLTKQTLASRLKKEYDTVVDEKMLKSEMVGLYMEAWIEEVESKLK